MKQTIVALVFLVVGLVVATNDLSTLNLLEIVPASENNNTIIVTTKLTSKSKCLEIHSSPMSDDHCCPTPDGIFLDCCVTDTKSTDTGSLYEQGILNSTFDFMMEDNSSTSALVHSSSHVSRRATGPIWRSIRSQCIFQLRCLLLGLSGACCPTVSGQYLDCCRHKPKTCSSYRACGNLTGDCCPTTSGVFLECCRL
jgi:hypothetical protein